MCPSRAGAVAMLRWHIMQVVLAPILVILLAVVLVSTRTWSRRARRIACAGAGLACLGVAVALTLHWSRIPSGALREDLFLPLPLLYAVLLGEVWLAEAAVHRLLGGRLRPLQVVLVSGGALGLQFGTMLALVMVLPV